MNDQFHDNGAHFSECRKYRYVLWRTWDKSKPKVMFLGLNPSTADEVKNDPTVSRCINYSKSWDFGGMFMMNIFSYRTTYPSELKKEKNPIGHKNDYWISKIYKNSELCIGAWGNDGFFLKRSNDICSLIPELFCLKINKCGEPAHPLYLKSSLEPTVVP